MDLYALMRHVDFTNPVSWAALTALLLAAVNTVTNLLKLAGDRPRLRVEAMVQGPKRAPEDVKAAEGDGVTLTMYSVGSKPVALSHVCGERVEEGFRMPFEIHQHPRNEWRLEPGAMRTAWALDAKVLDRSLRWLGAADNLGHVWKVPRRQLRKLIRREERARRAALLELCKNASDHVAH
jgi:hypothetical protein